MNKRESRKREKCEQVRCLLDLTMAVVKKSRGAHFRDYQIFIEVLGDSQGTRDAFYKFLHDVSTCPKKVVRWCQEQVNPKASG